MVSFNLRDRDAKHYILMRGPAKCMPLKFGIIEQTVQFQASPAEIYNALLDPGKHSEFTGSPSTTSRRTGAKFNAWDGYISGKNLKLVKDKKIVQEWKTTKWPRDYPSSRLELTLTRKADETELKMVHSSLPAEQLEDYRKGWLTSYWTPLKECLERNGARK